MHLDEAADAGVCPVCQRRWSEVDGGDAWLHLEVTREGSDDLDYLNEDFCCQEHAALWLSRPLPPPTPLQPLETTWRDRLEDLGVLLMFLIPGAFARIGVVATFSWLGLYG